MENLQQPLRDGRPRALIQMATSPGKTLAAANIAYRLIKHADARRVLFLVDCARLGDSRGAGQDRKWVERKPHGEHILKGRPRP
jgi:type I site-specific restriction endonuclease